MKSGFLGTAMLATMDDLLADLPLDVALLVLQRVPFEGAARFADFVGFRLVSKRYVKSSTSNSTINISGRCDINSMVFSSGGGH